MYVYMNLLYLFIFPLFNKLSYITYVSPLCYTIIVITTLCRRYHYVGANKEELRTLTSPVKSTYNARLKNDEFVSKCDVFLLSLRVERSGEGGKRGGRGEGEME